MPLKRLQEADAEARSGGARDVQATTVPVDAIARYVCNTWEEALAAQPDAPPFDVVVIGSGVYGGYVAAKLWGLRRALGARTRRGSSCRRPARS